MARLLSLVDRINKQNIDSRFKDNLRVSVKKATNVNCLKKDTKLPGVSLGALVCKNFTNIPVARATNLPRQVRRYAFRSAFQQKLARNTNR
jgi:hypothetical protein